MPSAPSLPAGLILVRAESPSLLEQIYALRVAAWRTEVTLPPDITRWHDGFDLDACHWAVLRDGLPVAAARLSIHADPSEMAEAEVYLGKIGDVPPPIATLNRCVVHPSHRHKGLATLLDKTRIAYARQSVCRTILCTALTPQRLQQLQALGLRGVAESAPYRDPITPGKTGMICRMDL